MAIQGPWQQTPRPKFSSLGGSKDPPDQNDQYKPHLIDIQNMRFERTTRNCGTISLIWIEHQYAERAVPIVR